MKKKTNKTYSLAVAKEAVPFIKGILNMIEALEKKFTAMSDEMDKLAPILKGMCDIMARGFKLYDKIYEKEEESEKKLLD
jgi:phage-related minor tail protein